MAESNTESANAGSVRKEVETQYVSNEVVNKELSNASVGIYMAMLEVDDKQRSNSSASGHVEVRQATSKTDLAEMLVESNFVKVNVETDEDKNKAKRKEAKEIKGKAEDEAKKEDENSSR